MKADFFSRHEKKFLMAARLVLGVVFVWASLDKIYHPDLFARSVANYQLLPEVLVNLAAVVLPWVELICGLLLLSGQWARAAALITALMLLVFIVAVGISLARGLDIHCGCFDTASGRQVGLTLLIEDLGLFVLALLLTVRASDRLGWPALRGD